MLSKTFHRDAKKPVKIFQTVGKSLTFTLIFFLHGGGGLRELVRHRFFAIIGLVDFILQFFQTDIFIIP